VAERWTEHKQTFLSFSADGRRTRSRSCAPIRRPLLTPWKHPTHLRVSTHKPTESIRRWAASASYAEDLKMAIALELKACACYEDVAARSGVVVGHHSACVQARRETEKPARQKLDAMLKEA